MLDFLLPPRCANCRQRGVWLCDACRAALVPIAAPACQRCHAALDRPGVCAACHAHPPAFNVAYGAFRYAGPLQPAIKRFKYGGERALATALGELLADAATDLSLQPDLIVPVPLHPERRRQRGYNQSELLARAVAGRLDRPVSTMLSRTRPTPPQVGQAAAARRLNVSGAFDWSGGPLNGQRVLLIDDVCTTGSTFDACARALRAHGPAAIVALALARD